MSYNDLGKFHCFKVVFYQLDCDPRIYALQLGKATRPAATNLTSYNWQTHTLFCN